MNIEYELECAPKIENNAIHDQSFCFACGCFQGGGGGTPPPIPIP